MSVSATSPSVNFTELKRQAFDDAVSDHHMVCIEKDVH